MDSEEISTGFEYWQMNFLGLIMDSAFFSIAMSFIDTTIISVFILEATGSTLLVGLLQMVRISSFYVSQILSININSKKYKKKIFMKWTLIGRSCLILVIFTTFLTNDISIVIFSLFISLIIFHFCDGFTLVSWFEFIVKSFPSNRRGTFFGFSQFIGGLSAVLAGFVILKILGDPNLIFPKNYGMLFLIDLIILLFGFSFFFLLKEKPDDEPKEKISLLESLKEIPRIIRDDKNVRRLAIIQLLISFYFMASPFYSIYILIKLSASESILGLLLTFQMLGHLIFSFITARLSNKNLNKKLIQYAILTLLAPPILIVAIGTLPYRVIAYSSMLIFTLIGASMGGIWVGIQNYVISEVKDKRRRPILLGFISSINVITSILPLLGGIIVGYLPYEAVFVASFIPILFGLMLTHNLK